MLNLQRVANYSYQDTMSEGPLQRKFPPKNNETLDKNCPIHLEEKNFPVTFDTYICVYVYITVIYIYIIYYGHIYIYLLYYSDRNLTLP